jgi:hypothetical protein
LLRNVLTGFRRSERTCTPYGTALSTLRVYRFRHAGMNW